MGDFKGVAIIMIVVLLIGSVFYLAWRNIKDDIVTEEDYTCEPEAGSNIKTSVGKRVAFVGKNNAEEQNYPIEVSIRYKWDFEGDGVIDWNERTLVTAWHEYNEAGSYTATFYITLEDDINGISLNESDSISVKVVDNTRPNAVFEVSSNNVNTSEPVQFSAINSSDNEDSLTDLTFQWDMDNDGIQDINGKEIFYSYRNPGDYLVILTVTDSGGLTDTATTMIYVSQGQGGDKYYIDMIVTCDNGNEEVITFFSEKEVSIEETNHET